MNDPLIEAIKKAGLPHDKYQTTTIVNTDDAIIGTGPFVRSSIEGSKKEFPWSQFIVDDTGAAKKHGTYSQKDRRSSFWTSKAT